MILTPAEKLNVISIIANVVDEELGEDLNEADMETAYEFFIDVHMSAYDIGCRVAAFLNQCPDPKFTRTAEKIYLQIEGNLLGFRDQ